VAAAGPVALGDGEGDADVVATGDATGDGAGDTVEVGAGAVSARAGEIVAAVSEASVTTNAVKSAVVFRIEFTFCLS
jgi:hypothetical protein